MNRPTVVITHHTGGTDADPKADTSNHTVGIIDAWHRTRWPDFYSSKGWWVGYHFFIEKDGKITQTRALNEEGAHTIGMNNSSIGICFAGNFDVTMPTEAQLNSFYKIYDDLLTKFPNIPTFPHRKYAAKTCHGSLLQDNYFVISEQIHTLRMKVDQLKAQLLSLVTGRRQR